MLLCISIILVLAALVIGIYIINDVRYSPLPGHEDTYSVCFMIFVIFTELIRHVSQQDPTGKVSIIILYSIAFILALIILLCVYAREYRESKTLKLAAIAMIIPIIGIVITFSPLK